MATATTKNTTAQQRRVIHSEGVVFLGWDENNRPVIEAKAGTWADVQRWALTRDGDPVPVKGFIRQERGV